METCCLTVCVISFNFLLTDGFIVSSRYLIIFSPPFSVLKTRMTSWKSCLFFFFFQVLHSMVNGIERPPTNPSGSPLIIRCKNFQFYHFLIPLEKDCLDVQASLTRLSRPGVLLKITSSSRFMKIYSGVTIRQFSSSAPDL